MVKKRILLVDDSSDLVELYKTILEMDGNEVITALSGNEALTVLSRVDVPDLILLDLNMEDMSGLDFLASLEQMRPPVAKSVPIVFFTAMEEIPPSRAVGIIRKPIGIDEFLEAVHSYTGVR